MKQNLKVNLVWLGLLVAGFALIQVLVAAGVLNLFYIQILEQIGINIILAVGLNLIVGFLRSILTRSCRIYGDWCLLCSYSRFQITNLWCFLWCDGFRCVDCWCRCLDRWGSNPSVERGLPRDCDTWGF